MRVADATAHLPASRAIVLVDDGLATGSTMLAALRALREQSPARVIVAVPVAAPETCGLMEDEADEVVCAATPEPFHAVGLWYEDFEQTTDEEVRELLERAREERRDARAQGAGEVQVDVAAGDRVALEGDLAVPEGAIGVVLFAHGSGSSRHSPRNRQVARTLRRFRLGTLLIDLLTPEEGEAERYTRHLRFDIDLLADRVVGAARWLSRYPLTQHLPIGCSGASTGAAAALVAAAREPGLVRAVVSRGGRPDLAGGRPVHSNASRSSRLNGSCATSPRPARTARKRRDTEWKLESADACEEEKSGADRRRAAGRGG